MNYTRLQIIEDDPVSRGILGEMLQDDYALSFHGSAEAGLDSIGIEQPELVLMDITLPDMDGIKACQLIKSRPETSTLPVIFVSATDDPAIKELGFDAGGQDYITKPFAECDIKARLNWHLNQKRQFEQMSKTRTLLEKEVTLLTERLIEAQRQRLRTLETKGIVHNLRNPLAAISGFAELILHTVNSGGAGGDTTVAERIKDYSGRISRESIYMSKLVDNILKCSESDADVTVVDLNQIVMDEMESLFRSVPDICRQVHCSAHSLPVTASKVEISQVLRNLVDNAIRAVEAVKEPVITVSTYMENGLACLTVEDNGKGIPPQVMPLIFEPFYTTCAGFGLGLFTCRAIAKSCGGGIAVSKGRDGHGTKFMFSLPLRESEM